MVDRVLIVEDEETLRENLARYLTQHGLSARGVGSAEEALVAATEEDFDVALVDIRLPGRDGLSLASDLSTRDVPVVVMTAYSSVESAIDAFHSGVHDYLVKPLLLREVTAKVERLCAQRRLIRENSLLRRQLGECAGKPGPVARSRAFQDVLSFVEQVAGSSSTVLIEGESGSGKEVVARHLHDASPRRNGPFVPVNVSAIPDTLLESHLFGHEKGAFTGADAKRDGLVRSAQGGTLFLDEIGEMALPQQVKLLRVLETKEILPVGGNRPTRVDVRVVAATNADLQDLMRDKLFRSDLFYRLSAIHVRVPPLRARLEDVPALAQHFLSKHVREHHRNVSGFDAASMRALLTHPWPGNARELSNVVERAVLVCRSAVIGVGDLPPEITGGARAASDHYDDAMAEFERTLIGTTLARVGGDRKEAARVLGMSLPTLYRRIEKLGLKGERAREGESEAAE